MAFWVGRVSYALMLRARRCGGVPHASFMGGVTGAAVQARGCPAGCSGSHPYAPPLAGILGVRPLARLYP